MTPNVDTDQLRPLLNLLNQVFEIEKKVARLDDPGTIGRNVRRMKDMFENDLSASGGFAYDDPTGQPYDETRTDCEATIIGESTEGLVIVDVIKPIVRYTANGFSQIVQRAVVTVESRDAAQP